MPADKPSALHDAELLELRARLHMNVAIRLEAAAEALRELAAAGADLSPHGCAWRVDGVDCAARLHRRICDECGAIFARCATHTKRHQTVDDDLTRHRYQEHGLDDRSEATR